MVAKAPCSKAMKKKALQSLPTVSWAAWPEQSEQEEAPECVICLAEFACGDKVRVLPPCVDVWLLSSSTCPSCQSALVVSTPATELPTTDVASAQAGASEGRCRFLAP